MKYKDLHRAVHRARAASQQDGIPPYFYRSKGKIELTYPALSLPDNDSTFNQLCKLAEAGLVEFSGIDETVIII